MERIQHHAHRGEATYLVHMTSKLTCSQALRSVYVCIYVHVYVYVYVYVYMYSCTLGAHAALSVVTRALGRWRTLCSSATPTLS